MHVHLWLEPETLEALGFFGLLPSILLPAVVNAIAKLKFLSSHYSIKSAKKLSTLEQCATSIFGIQQSNHRYIQYCVHLQYDANMHTYVPLRIFTATLIIGGPLDL